MALFWFSVPGISESLANTLKQKELLMERIKQYKEISKRPMKKPVQTTRKDSVSETFDLRKVNICIIYYQFWFFKINSNIQYIFAYFMGVPIDDSRNVVKFSISI